MDRISICELLLEWNKIEPRFLKWHITSNKKWITYNNIQKSSWSKQDKAPQTVAKPGLTPREMMLCVCVRVRVRVCVCVCDKIEKESFITSCCRLVKQLILISTDN